MRVIASSIRKGNIIEREDGQLCVVLSAESFHPGKGTPTTQIDMRRLSDGVKVTDRFKTTEQVERAFVEDKEFDFLYADGDGISFHERRRPTTSSPSPPRSSAIRRSGSRRA